jgi:hypothetical protein
MPPPRLQRPVGWLRDLPIWTKLGLIMIVPTIATIVVGTAGLLDKVQAANNADRARTLAVLSGEAGGLVHELQDERAVAVRLLKASTADVDRVRNEYAAQYQQTDQANIEYRQSRSTLADIPPNLRALLDSIEGELGELPVLRSEVEPRNKITLRVTVGRYDVLIADLLAIRDLSAQLAGDTTLTDRLRAAGAIATAKEFLSQERVVVLEALLSGDWSRAVRTQYTATREGREIALDSFTAVATPEQEELLNRTVAGPEVRETLKYEGRLDSLDATIPRELTAANWDKAMVGRSNLMNTVETTLNSQAQQAAVQLGDRVQREVLIETGLLLVTLLLGVLFAWLVARSMARSLRDLRQGALAVAQYGLPQAVARLRDPALSSQMSPATVAGQIAEPLPVRSRDEFGQVTEAFNAVHLEAVRTAAEQAALRASVATMFVNLARRSQILVDRLIGHLDRLERGEQDPDRLSELFQLDHLATRMRRNDENLLVLAGADSTRIQREPAALMDVLRAAQSEVEHYTRIEFGIIDQDIEIAAHAVNDLVHLVAELFDNATAFSPPDSPISVEARRVGDRAVLQVEDRGIGMSPDQYSETNERLATPPMVDVAVSRMMGLVVVARLGARHGVKVELRPAQERGTVADVLLPSAVLVPRALAGRSQAPAGFPASRPMGSPPMHPIFPEPLALESGPAAMGAGWPSASDAWGSTTPPSRSTEPAGASGYGGPPGTGNGGTGLGAALTGGLAGSAFGGHGPNGANTGGPGGRSLPAWHDLTGATGSPDAGQPPPGTPGGDPLPQRRPGAPPWRDSESEDGPVVPRQTPASPEWGVPADAPAAPAASSLPTMPPPTTGRPPVWPPVAPAEGGPGEAMPAVPEGLSASLDMTSELPKIRSSGPTGESGDADASPPPSRYADDLTMELPIFRELESAWFRSDPYAAEGASSPVTGDGDWIDEETADSAAMASSARAAPGAGPRGPGGAGGAGTAGGEVSWPSVADDGWLAAEAALTPADGGTTETGLPRRVPMAQLVPGGVEVESAASDRRTPEAVRGLLSAYHRGVQRGRSAQGKEPTGSTSHSSGKEHEA